MNDDFRCIKLYVSNALFPTDTKFVRDGLSRTVQHLFEHIGDIIKQPTTSIAYISVNISPEGAYDIRACDIRVGILEGEYQRKDQEI